MTLTGGAGLAITTGLQLDSGGILVVGTNTSPTSYPISGPGVLTGTNSNNREMIFHVTGSQTTLDVTAPIYSNGGGLTKADGGLLTLGAQEFYTGTTAVNQGTLQLAGGNNTIFSVYTVAPTPGSPTLTFSGQVLSVNNGGTLDLNGTNQAFSVLNTGNNAQLEGGTILNSTLPTHCPRPCISPRTARTPGRAISVPAPACSISCAMAITSLP